MLLKLHRKDGRGAVSLLLELDLDRDECRFVVKDDRDGFPATATAWNDLGSAHNHFRRLARAMDGID